jgi:acetylglutamate kinase
VKLVIKIGGAALEDKSILPQFAQAVVQLAQDGHDIAVVHGGGATLTRTLNRLGKHTCFVNGLRVTDAETRDVAVMVLAGIVNKTVVAAINTAGRQCVGLCGGDGLSFWARKKKTVGDDLGYVGEIASVDCGWLEAILVRSAIPVIASIGLGSDGEYYNINADEMASGCAVACGANALIFLTDVPGVRDASGEVMPWLDLKQIPILTRQAVIGGGMLPKLEACSHALHRGVRRVRILPAAKANVLCQFYFAKLDCGTEVIVQ